MRQVASKRALVVVLGAAAVALGGAGLVWRGRVASERWQAALGEVRALEARLDATVDERSALWGETTDERAQPHYDRALSLVAGWDPGLVRAAARAEDEEARSQRALFLAAGSEALEALHRGAHAADATRTVDWSLGFELPMRKLMHARLLVQLCEMKAAVLRADGRELEAVGVLLDALQLAGDLSQGPILIEGLIGVALLAPDTLVDGVADGSLLSLSDDAEERLAAGVSALDRRLGWRAPSLEGELVLCARGLERAFRAESCGWRAWTSSLGSGGFGLTPYRLYAAEHVTATLALCAELDRAFAAGPTALFDAIERLPERSGVPGNPISATVLPKLDSVYRGRLYSLGRFRLLAHAISPSHPPQDPWLAEHLRVEETEEGTRLRLDHEAFDGVEVRVGG